VERGFFFTPLEIMPRCSAAGLGFIIIPAGFDAPLGFESQRLEFLTGSTTDSILIINPQPKFAITNWVDAKVLKGDLAPLPN
jgi:hypothetical protein